MDQGWDFHAMEERDGLRMTWHEWPASKLDATRVVIPIGCTYTPLRQIEGMPPALEYEPVRCKQPKCGAVLNPYWCVPASVQSTPAAPVEFSLWHK